MSSQPWPPAYQSMGKEKGDNSTAEANARLWRSPRGLARLACAGVGAAGRGALPRPPRRDHQIIEHRQSDRSRLAVDETVILLHPPLPLVSVSIVMERERQQIDSLVNG